MKKYIKYNEYLAWYEWVEEDKEYHGRLLGVEPIIGIYGENLEELKKDFRNAIKDYEEDFLD